MPLETRPFDPAEYLTDAAGRAAYLSAALEAGDPAELGNALGVLARAIGMTAIAQRSGLGRESLYKALSGTGNPEFATVFRVLRAMDLRLVAAPNGDDRELADALEGQ